MIEVTFKYRVVLKDKSVHYYIDMRELRKYVRKGSESLIEQVEKYYKSKGLWVRIWYVPKR